MIKEYFFENTRRKPHIRRSDNMAEKSKCEGKRMLVRVLLTVFLFQMSVPLYALSAEPKTIRVGYFAFPGYHEYCQDENGLQGSGVSTDPYIQLTMSRVTKKDFRGEIHTVAVAYNQMYDEIDIDMAENVQAVAYDTRKEALQAVKDGTVDACYVYTYMAEKFVNQDPDGELIFHIVNMPAADLSITIRPTIDHELISILNKCLKADQSLVMDELVEKYTRYEQPDVTLAKFIRNNPWFLVALLAILLGVGTVIVLILRNNRNMREVAEERTALAASLKEKNRLLEESVQQAQSANIAKTTFLNNMSHDIRTPMNAIIGFSNIALKHQPKPEVRSCLEKIGESSEHLLTLINDVLDIFPTR